MSESNFTRPAANLANDALGYAGAQLDNLKLRSVKALSSGTGTIFWFAIVLILLSIMLLILSFAFVIWIGEKMGSYAAAAFIVAGALAVLLVIVLLLRRVLFKGTFLSAFSKAFFPKAERIRNNHDLEKAILRNEVTISKQETLMTRSFGDAKQYYANPRLVVDGVGSVVGLVSSLFAKKDGEKKEDREAKKEEKARKREENKEQKEQKKASKKEKDDAGNE